MKAVLIALVALGVACGKKEIVLDEPVYVAPAKVEKPQEGSPIAAEPKQEKPPEFADKISIYFDFDSYLLRSNDIFVLNGVAAEMQENQGMRLLVMGGTCPIGDYEYNMMLGMQRAQSVKKYLTDAGISPFNVECGTWGEDENHLICSENEECYWENRRSELMVEVR